MTPRAVPPLRFAFVALWAMTVTNFSAFAQESEHATPAFENSTAIAVFKDSFESPPDPLKGIVPACIYQMGWRPSWSPLRTENPPYGNCWNIYAPAAPFEPGKPYDGERLLREAIKRARANNKLIALTMSSPYWANFANEPDVVWIMALDEPDGSLSGNSGRCTRFVNELKEAERIAPDVPKWCNFSMRNVRGIAFEPEPCNTYRGTPYESRYCWNFDPKPLDACEIDAFPHDLCDVISYTPAYGVGNIGPYKQQAAVAAARGMKNGALIDAYNGWDRDSRKQCGTNPSLCQQMRHTKAVIMRNAALESGNLAGFMIFVHGRPWGDRGCGTDCQPDLMQNLAPLFPPLPPGLSDRINGKTQ